MKRQQPDETRPRCPIYYGKSVWIRGKGIQVADIENQCQVCGHRYQVTTWFAIHERSFKCPCCRRKTAKQLTRETVEDAARRLKHDKYYT